MRITYFFRKPSPVYHSIEKLFITIIENIKQFETVSNYAPYPSKGLISRLRIAWNARKNQSEINHVTGDIHFIAPFLNKQKTILTIHDIGVLGEGNILKRSIIKFFWFTLPLKRVKLVTVISEFTKQELLKHCKIKAEKIIVINNCISDIYKASPKQNTSEKPVILQIGTKTNKNLLRVINAVKSIECKLIIVGKLSEKQLIWLKENKIDYENHINISNEEMLHLYVMCDILVYVSTYEGFGMPVVEANAVGRAVLSSNIEPIKSVADNAALLVNPFNEDEIREGLKKLIDDEKLRKELIENGFVNAEKYRASFIAKNYEKVYDLVLQT